MKKKYLTPIVGLLLFAIPSMAAAQDIQNVSENNVDVIDGFSIFPNPATGDKIHVKSNLGHTKQIKIYDVLGKQRLFKVLVGEELDISSLNSGVYYIEITEHKITKSLKFIVVNE